MSESTTFESLELEAHLLDRLDALGYEFATPVQALAIPPAIAGKDVLATARTGTGKTAAFIVRHTSATPYDFAGGLDRTRVRYNVMWDRIEDKKSWEYRTRKARIAATMRAARLQIARLQAARLQHRKPLRQEQHRRP